MNKNIDDNLLLEYYRPNTSGLAKLNPAHKWTEKEFTDIVINEIAPKFFGSATSSPNEMIVERLENFILPKDALCFKDFFEHPDKRDWKILNPGTENAILRAEFIKEYSSIGDINNILEPYNGYYGLKGNEGFKSLSEKLNGEKLNGRKSEALKFGVVFYMKIILAPGYQSLGDKTADSASSKNGVGGNETLANLSKSDLCNPNYITKFTGDIYLYVNDVRVKLTTNPGLVVKPKRTENMDRKPSVKQLLKDAFSTAVKDSKPRAGGMLGIMAKDVLKQSSINLFSKLVQRESIELSLNDEFNYMNYPVNEEEASKVRGEHKNTKNEVSKHDITAFQAQISELEKEIQQNHPECKIDMSGFASNSTRITVKDGDMPLFSITYKFI